VQVAATSSSGPFRLNDGRSIWLRPLRRDDASRLLDLRARLSAESVRRRFLRDRAACDPRDVEQLVDVDQVLRVAVAAVPQRNADGPILGVGRFHGDGSARAEFALLVEDAYQHIGLGRLLLGQLIAEARRRGLYALDGYTLFNNLPVLRLLRTSGQPLEVRYAGGGDVLEVELLLDAPPPPARHFMC
jgi:GNAT superfamily N-acetyltransferase